MYFILYLCTDNRYYVNPPYDFATLKVDCLLVGRNVNFANSCVVASPPELVYLALAYIAYTGTSGRQIRRHPDSKPALSGHLVDWLDCTVLVWDKSTLSNNRS